MRPDHPGNDDDIDLWLALYAAVICSGIVALIVYLACR